MPEKSEILLVTREAETQRAVTSALEASLRLETGGVYTDYPELVARLESRPATAVLVDIDPRPDEALRGLERITARFLGTRFVVVSSTVQSELVLEAMQAGARHCLRKESIASELVGVLNRLLPQNGRSDEGCIVTVLSASGGCGATTLAVNLANEIRLMTGSTVLIVDLDSAYGAVSSYLDVRGQYTVADVLSSAGRIDAELIRSTALSRSDGVHALINPASGDTSLVRPLNYAALDETLKACRQAYAYTVIDAPRVPADVAVTLAAASHLTLLVLQLAVKDLQMARVLWNVLSRSGVTSDQVLALANRYSRRHQLVSLEDAQKTLRDIRIEPINNDYRSSSASLNYGLPLAQTAPKSLLRRDLEKLAGRISRSRLSRFS